MFLLFNPRIKAFLLLSGFLCLALSLSAQETLSFTVLNGAEIRCYPDSVVQIEITPNTDFDFSVIVVDWGDGTTEQIQPGEPLILEHAFPIAQFLEDCSYQTCGTEVGFCFQVAIDAAYGGAIPPENISKRITFKFPPRPVFAPSLGYICPDAEFTLVNVTCPENDPGMTYSWTLPDGSTSTEFEPDYVFNNPGVFPITLTATNECGSISTTRNTPVNELAVAEITPDMGFQAINGDSLVVCLSDGGKINLTSEESENVTTYLWAFSPNDGFNPEDSISHDSMCLLFTPQAGAFYDISLTVDNACMVPSTDTYTVEVVPLLELALAPQDDACLSLEYTPSPLLPEVRYSLNGTDYSSEDFPITLGESTTPYLLEATAANRCDTLILRDTFLVFGEFEPSITLPAEDITLCRDTNLVLLETDGQGTNWSVSQGADLIFQDGQVFFNPDQEDGDYVVTFSQGFGACEGTATRTVTVQSPALTLDGPWAICEESANLQLSANQSGGIWSGEGVISTDGIFSPDNLAPGEYEVFYTYNDAAATGCITTRSSTVEVVGLPELSNFPESLSLCDIDEELSLPALTGVAFDPSGGEVDWIGAGIVDHQAGIYNPATVNGGADTVTLRYEIDPGCIVSDTLLLSVDSLVSVNAGDDFVFCDNVPTLQLSAQPDDQGEWSGLGVNPQTGIVNPALLSTGQTYDYIYTVNANIPSCESRDTVSVAIADGEGVSLPFNEAYLCDTAAFLALPEGSPSSGAWSGHTGIINDTLFFTGLTPDTLTLSFTVAALPEACNGAELDVFFSPRPSVEIINDSTACEDVDCLLFAAQGNAAAWDWDFGDGAASNEMSPCHTYTDPGFYEVALTGFLVNPVTNQSYCASPPATASVDILGELPPVNILPSEISGCPDFSVNLAPSEVDDRFTYTWTIHDIADSVATALQDILLPATAEDTTYLALLTTTNGCDVQTDTLELIANAPFQAAIGTDFDTPCSGETVSFYNLSTGTASGPLEWSFSTGQSFTAIEPPPLPVFTDSLPTVLEVTAIGGNLCNSDTAIYEIEVQPTDVRARMNYSDEVVCAGASLEMANISTPGAPVTWVTSDGNSYLSQTVSHVFSTPNDSAWVTIYAEGCGFDSLRYFFEVLPPPEMNLEFDPIGCANVPSIFSIGGNATEQLLYYGTGDSTFLSSSTYTYTEPGTYDLTAYGRSPEGCRDSVSASIEIAPVPDPAVAPVDSVCAGEPFTLSSQSIGASSCLWAMADGGTRDNCETNYSFSTPGLKQNTLLVTSAVGCSDSLLFPVFVRPTPMAQIDFSRSGVCSPVSIQFTSVDTATTPDNWQWDFGDGATGIVPNPVHTYPAGGDYTVQLTVSTGGICFDSTLEIISVAGTPAFDTLITDDRCLPGDAFVLEVGTEASHEITVTGEGYYQAGINRFEITEPGNYELEVLSQEGCDSSLQFSVPPVFPIQVDLMPDTSILLGEAVRIISEVNASDLDFEWSPNLYLEEEGTLQPLARPFETTTYLLSVTDGSCAASGTITITVNEEVQVYFPNAFSPNGDGVNDRYRFYPVVGVEEILSFQIYDRWGEVVYNHPAIDQAIFHAGEVTTWDGLLDGSTMNPGVFTYLAKVRLVNGEEKKFAGDLHLLR